MLDWCKLVLHVVVMHNSGLGCMSVTGKLKLVTEIILEQLLCDGEANSLLVPPSLPHLHPVAMPLNSLLADL